MIRKIAVVTLALLCSTAAFAIVKDDSVGSTLVFPIVGSVEGANDTRFRSEITLVNFKDTTQELLVEFLERGATVPFAEHRIEIEGRKFRFWNDFVASEIAREGKLGALRVRAVNAGTTVTDTSARINGFSRIWTEQPNGPGTSSMSLPAVAVDDLSASVEAAYIVGARQNTQYRTNVGIVNLVNADRVFTVEIAPSAVGVTAPPMTITVPANSMMQVPLPEGSFEGLMLKITPAAAGAWSAYSASVDNQSGDGWIARAQYSTDIP